jgi:hypothetical protein
MKSIRKQITFIVLFTVFSAVSAQPKHEHSGKVITPKMIQAQKIASDNAHHMGNKGTKYKSRNTILVDLKKIGNPQSNPDFYYMPNELTIELRDEIYSRLGNELPAGTDFAIWVAQYKGDNENIASMEIALPKGASDIDFSSIDFILSVGPIERYGFYLGDPDRELNYFERDWSWTKKTGLAAIKKALKTGSPDVQSTVIFRDKHDSSLGKNNPYHDVIYFLSDGNERAFVDIDNYTNTVRYTTNVRQDQLKYLKENELVANIVPNLPEPKKN